MLRSLVLDINRNMPAALLDDVHMQRWSLSGVQMRVWIDIGWLEALGNLITSSRVLNPIEEVKTRLGGNPLHH